LTLGLIDKGIQPKRVINVTSELYKKGKVDLDDMLNPRKYKGQQVYSNTKKAILMLSNELFNLYGKSVEVVAIHPGVVATNAFREYPNWFSKLLNTFLEKPETAAHKIAELALTKNIKNGCYYHQNIEKSALSGLVNETDSKNVFKNSQKFKLKV
jgi:NAD(P)-dependent dehydrogenase (short-subunit alcohol dehydrogenase family)